MAAPGHFMSCGIAHKSPEIRLVQWCFTSVILARHHLASG